MGYTVEREPASKGVAGTGLGLGAAGTATGVPALIMSAIALLRDNQTAKASQVAAQAGMSIESLVMLMGCMNMQHNNCPAPAVVPAQPVCHEAMSTSYYDLDCAKELAAKDGIIAEYKAKEYTNQAVLDLHTYVDNQFEKRDVIFDAHRSQVSKQFTDIAVFQGAQVETSKCLANQINGINGVLRGLTEVVVPSTHVCDRTIPTSIISSECNPVYISTVSST